MTDTAFPPGFGPVWVLLDDRAGNRAQALGVADALGRPYETRELAYGALAALPNAVLGASVLGIEQRSRAALAEPWPALVIAAGRRTAPVARWIKRRSGGRARLLQVMDPGAGRADFDLLAVPAHDAWDGQGAGAAKVVRVTAAPNRMTPAALAQAAEAWRDTFRDLPGPRIALLVGGSTRRRRFTPAMARELGATVRGWADQRGGSLLVTTSRRTGAEAAQALFAAVSGVPCHAHRWDDPGDNPYAGMLALADHIVVTGESVSMCSEAAAAAKPVSIYAPDALIAPKHARLHAALFAAGHAHPLSAGPDVPAGPGLSTAGDIVRELQGFVTGSPLS